MTTKDKKIGNPEEVFQQQKQIEDDLARLQRQYHILERDRDNFHVQNGKQSKVKKVLNILKKEHNELITDLNVAGSEANSRRDRKIVQTIGELLVQHNEYLRKIEEDKSFIKELQMQSNIMQKQVVELSSKQVTDFQLQARILNGQKTLDAQENKLENAVRRFCVVQANNKRLRAEINHLLIERTEFNKQFEKLISNLASGKKFMLDLIEQASLAYDQREEWCSKLQALRARAANDIIGHTQECQELESQINHETKLQTFLSTKSQKRIMRNLIRKQLEKRMKAKIVMEDTIGQYKGIISDIQAFAEEENLKEICEKFIAGEAEVYARFELVTDVNRQMELYSDELNELHFKIDEQRRLNLKRGTQQSTKLLNLTSILTKITVEAAEQEKKLTRMELECQALLKGIEKLFQMCKCVKTPFIDLLGNNNTISNFNALLYLEELEKRVSDLIKFAYYREKVMEPKKHKESLINDDKIRHVMATVEVMVPTSPCPLCVEQEHVNDVVDTLQFAQNRAGIEKLLAKHLRVSGASHVIHNVSACNLPKSREIIQRRYQ